MNRNFECGSRVVDAGREGERREREKMGRCVLLLDSSDAVLDDRPLEAFPVEHEGSGE